MTVRQILIGLLVFLSWMPVQAQIVHDAEYYVLKMQNGERWQQEDSEITRRLQALRDKYGQPPNIVFLLWDDTAFGAVGFPALQKNFGYSTPNLNKMAAEGINFTRMYSEPSCTPTRAAVLTGRHPVRFGMGAVGMPHEFSGLRAEEVTIAEVLSRAGYATGFFGKGHLGDIEESYLHNQGFDEALFTPMNQITSLFNPQANAVNAVLGMFPEIYPPDPYRLDNPGLVPTGWVMNIEGEKGQPGREWCGTSNECFSKFDPEAERRTIAFIRKNAEANKPFFVAYWPNFLNFMAAFMPKPSVSGLMVADSFPAVDDFAGQLMDELQALGIAENTLFVAMADNGPMVHSPPAGWGMLPMLYRGGKGDFTEGGVRVPAFAWWPGMVQPGQVVGDIIHIADLYTTFARLAGASEYIPTDRVVDGLDQTALLLNGDTHSRRDYVFIYTGNQLGATVKGRYKRHWIGAGEVASSGMPEAYYDLYMDPREEYPQLVPLIYTQGQFNHMVARHRLFKKKYPDVPSGKGIPYTGLANARPETKAIGQRVRAVVEEMPFSIEEYLEFQIPGADKVGDWGH
ncbi:sulfatase-like hydrolase/transferase [Microbulbifer sp. CnH-101-E]|uniref:sulfatase-like hydrolase/transferase n=1 Tax=unclassified Microbulbifer TaxID=2619833 RepID=UPI0040393D18